MTKVIDMDLVLMKHQITNTLLKHTNGFLVSVNENSEGDRYSTGVTINSLYFDTCRIGGYNSHLHFSNVNKEAIIHEGKEVYSLHNDASLYIYIEQIKSIQELDEEEKIDVLNLPCKRIFQITILEGDSITVGLL